MGWATSPTAAIRVGYPSAEPTVISTAPTAHAANPVVTADESEGCALDDLGCNNQRL